MSYLSMEDTRSHSIKKSKKKKQTNNKKHKKGN